MGGGIVDERVESGCEGGYAHATVSVLLLLLLLLLLLML